MPGRGTPWRKGKGKRGRIAEHDIEDDSVESIDIKDGTIQEVDLDSALQAKVNSTGGHAIQDEGTPLTQQSNLNFTGAGVTATFGAEDTTIVDIPGGGGSGGGVDVNTEFRFYDEFIYNVFAPNDKWETAGGIGAWLTTVSAIGGVVEKATAGESTSTLRLNVNQNSLVNVAKDFICRWRTKSAVVSLVAIRQGLITANGFPAGTFPFGTENTPYIWFASDGTGVTTNWLCETHDGSLQNSTDSGVAIDTAFHLFEVERTGTTITFRIDGSVVASFTTNLPIGNLQMTYIVQDGENVQKTQFVDTAELQNDL